MRSSHPSAAREGGAGKLYTALASLIHLGNITTGLWNSLAERLLWWLLVGAGLGAVLPSIASALKPIVSIVLAVMIGGLGLSLSLRELGTGLLQPRLLAVGMGAQLLSTPLVAFALWQLADLPATWTGIPVQAAAPSEITSPLMAQLAGGSLTGSISLLSVSILLAPVTMPLLLRLILGQTVSVPVILMLRSLLLTVAVPVLAGSIVYTALGWLAGAVFRLGLTTSRIVVFATGMREFGLASAVTLGFFETEAALFPAVYGVVMMVSSAWLASRLRSRL